MYSFVRSFATTVTYENGCARRGQAANCKHAANERELKHLLGLDSNEIGASRTETRAFRRDGACRAPKGKTSTHSREPRPRVTIIKQGYKSITRRNQWQRRDRNVTVERMRTEREWHNRHVHIHTHTIRMLYIILPESVIDGFPRTSTIQKRSSATIVLALLSRLLSPSTVTTTHRRVEGTNGGAVRSARFLRESQR